MVVSFNIKVEKVQPKTKLIYDYKKVDIIGLTEYIKNYDFENNVFRFPVLQQAELYSNMLNDAFSQFVPSKKVTIRPTDAPWCTNFTRLLLRKKNRNYLFYKKCEIQYKNALIDSTIKPEILTRLSNKRDRAWEKSRQAANDSSKFNRRAKIEFYNNVNSTMNNYSISPKKKFSILLRLMKNVRFSTIPPLVENDKTIHDSTEKSNILNAFFASKSTVPNYDEPSPVLDRKEGIPDIDILNTSPIEIAKFMRNMKTSWG